MSARLALVGAPGSGKTAIAVELAARWNAPVLDTDALYEQRYAETVADAVITDEAAFRQVEAQLVLECLSADGAVVAVGSGALGEDVRSALLRVPVVWLRVGLVDAVRRSGLSGMRPANLGPVRTQMHEMLLARDPVYASVADHEVSTHARMAQSVASDIEQWEANR